jgi:hypothetical protein
MKTLDEQWLVAKAEYDKAALRYGPRSKRAQDARSKMVGLLVRILRRDNRRRLVA